MDVLKQLSRKEMTRVVLRNLGFAFFLSTCIFFRQKQKGNVEIIS